MRSLIYYILIITFFVIAVIFSERAGDDTLWAVIFIFLFVLTIWLLVSTIVCLYWLYSPPDFFWVKHRHISTAFYVSAFFVCVMIVGMGIECLLWFIPEKWVYECEGDLQSVRYTVAHIIGFFVALFLFRILEKPCLQKQREQTEEKIRWEVEDLIQMLDYSEDDPILRGLKLEELRLEKLKLEALDSEGKLMLIQQRRLLVLNNLFNELDVVEEDNNINDKQEDLDTDMIE